MIMAKAEQQHLWPELAHNGTPTSRAAAKKHRQHAAVQRSRVLAAIIMAKDGATREELEGVTGLGGNSIRPRVRELIRAGLLKETGDTRKTRAGIAASVLRPAHA
jgi:hypothetical protein